jgi:signal transduction histidine kinase
MPAFPSSPIFYQGRWFALFCALLILCILWLFHFLRLRQATAQLRERLGAQAEEHERIAHELHDGLLQGFQGLVLRFEAIAKKIPGSQPAHQLMEDTLERADEVLRDGRERVRNLRDERETAGDLAEELTRYGKDQANASSFILTVLGNPQAVRRNIRNEASCIGREALINAFQHSRATKIEAEIIYRSRTVSLRIRDNGKGIRRDILAHGRSAQSGLSAMEDRACKIGARLSIWSRTGRGTEVDLTIPARVAYPWRQAYPIWQRMKRILGIIGDQGGG